MPPKRKSTDLDNDPAGGSIPIIDSDDERLDYIEWNCDQVRRRIRTFIECKEMKIGEFQDAIGVSSHSYLNFMGQNGKENGSGSATYINAARFFKKRELQGIKPPRKKRATKEAAKKAEIKYDVSDIHLDGESDLDVPVYDTCDIIRKKINTHLTDPTITKAGFLRDISKAALPDQRKLNGTSLSDFLSKRGPNAGNTGIIFYAAYVFFEKLRVKDKKPKTDFREEMEDVWPNGFDRVTPSNASYVCSVERTLYVDKYGRLRSALTRRA